MPEAKKPEDKKEEKKDEKPTPKDNIVTTKHTVRIGGKTIKYTVTTGTMVMKEEVNDKEKVSQVFKPSHEFQIILITQESMIPTISCKP